MPVTYSDEEFEAVVDSVVRKISTELQDAIKWVCAGMPAEFHVSIGTEDAITDEDGDVKVPITGFVTMERIP